MQKVRLLVSGRVQGVGFRYSTYALALEIGDIYGRVWNNDNGTVEILAQSDKPAKLAKFIQEVRKGPMEVSVSGEASSTLTARMLGTYSSALAA